MQTKTIAGFALRFLLYYGLLIVPWFGLPAAYGALYRGAANALFGTFGDQGLVRFDESPHAGAKLGTEISMRRRGSATVGRTPHNDRLVGYLPVAQLAALVLATPVAWSRRWRALLWGLLWIQLFTALRLYVTVAHLFTTEGPWRLYELDTFRAAVLARAFNGLVLSPTLSFVVPVFVWIAVTFRRGDLTGWLEGEPDPSPR